MNLSFSVERNVIKVILNVVFWLLIAALVGYGVSLSHEEDRTFLSLLLQGSMGITLFIVPAVYFNTLVLIPRLLIKRKYWQYALSVLFFAAIWPPLPIYISNMADARFFGTKPEDFDQPFSTVGIFVILFVVVLSTLVNMTYRAIWHSRKVGEIENERLNTELMMLRNQISPHFFFNTLNNLYALALEESKETPDVILKLSEMMRYTLYDCNTAYVPLSGEVTYLCNYISLQQIRHHQQVEITFEQYIDDQDVVICPLILIVFLENAFKHGVDSSENGSFVRMNLKADSQEINFTVINSVGERVVDEGGIGLENVQKRLELVYGSKYSLKAERAVDVFSVDLTIKLD